MEENNQKENANNSQKQGMKMALPLIVVGGLVLLAGGYYMMKKNNPPQTGTAVGTQVKGTSQQMPEPVNSGKTEETVVVGNNEIVVVGSSFKFSPETFTVSAGQKVTLVFDNTEGFHDLVFETLDVKTKQIQAGQKETLEFIAPSKPGEYVFYCSVGKHRALGMEGKMVVQ